MANTYDGIKNTVPATRVETAPETRAMSDGGGVVVPLAGSIQATVAFGLQVTCGTGGETAQPTTNAFTQYWGD
jgi:hypothetical protein